MQKLRPLRAGEAKSSYGQPGTLAWNTTHAALSGHELGAQLKTVQYPPGCELSHCRVLLIEQSVLRLHRSPMCGVQPARVASAPPNKGKTSKKRKRGRGRSMGGGTVALHWLVAQARKAAA
jgi:hypothetical protein